MLLNYIKFFIIIDIYFNNYYDALSFGTELEKLSYLRIIVTEYNAYSILGTQIEKIITHKILHQ